MAEEWDNREPPPSGGPTGGRGGRREYPLPDEVPQTESPKARQAWLDYWDLGPTRSLAKLQKHYVEQDAQGKPVPTKRLRQLEAWSSAFDWQARVMDRQVSVAEQADARVAEERAKWAKQRLDEARGLHTVAGAWVKEIIRRIQAGELQNLPFSGYWTALPFQQETVEEDWEACAGPGCAHATGHADPDCQLCGGSGRKLLGKGKRKTVAGTRVVKIDGLMDFGPAMTRMMDIGQKLERGEIGQEEKTEALVNAILSALPESLRNEIAAELAINLAEGTPRGGRSPKP